MYTVLKRFTSNQNSSQLSQSCFLTDCTCDLRRTSEKTHPQALCSHWPVNLSVWLLTCRLFPSRGCVSVAAGLSLTHLRVLALITFSTCSCFPTTVCFWSSCRPAKKLEGAFEPLAGREEVGWKRKGHLGVEIEEQVWHEAVIAHQNTSYLHTKQTKLCVLKEEEQA